MKLPYQKIDGEKHFKEFDELLNNFYDANSLDEELKILDDINNLRELFWTMYWISYINYLLDVNSEYWNEQEKFFAKFDSVNEEYKIKYYKALLSTKYREELESILGEKTFKIAELETKFLDIDIQKEKQKEKELISKYTSLTINLKVLYNNKEVSMSVVNKDMDSENREVRKKATVAKVGALESIEKEIDNILDELILVRNTIAKKLGFKEYTEYSYVFMGRIDYSALDVNTFREEVIKYIVPEMMRIKEKQKESLGLDKISLYDNNIYFKDGNPMYEGDTKWLVNQALKMYKSISPKLYDVFKMMVDESLMDLDSRDGKSRGGIATMLKTIDKPIFISNFIGLNRDVSTLIHEFGHSFQFVMSKDLKYLENWWPSKDEGEIHSTTLEYLTLPCMNLFFKENDKYIYLKMVGVLNSICNICLIDHFQNIIYEEDLSKEERKNRFRELEKKYMPWIDYSEFNYFDRGNSFQTVSHIFSSPFYYIDYALAYTVALQFYALSKGDEKLAWNKYIDLCSQGGKYTFQELLFKNQLKSPFKKGTLKTIVDIIKSEL